MFRLKHAMTNTFLMLCMLLFSSSLYAKVYDPNKTITIYVHGYNPNGYHRSGIYGENSYEDIFDKITPYTNLPTVFDPQNTDKPNVIAATSYYGDTPPQYYTQKDIDEIDAITQEYGGGIPRYAMIVAKYAKHLLEQTGAQQVNFVSGSMGSLVTRWLIEKNLENLASEKKIARWLSVEGVINGNYAASKSLLFKLYDELENVSVDVDHMKYKWIARNLSNPRTIGQSPYYKDILLGFETSTDDSAKDGLMTKVMILKGQFQPNDGYQAAGDTYLADILPQYRFLGQNPTHTYLHKTHLGIKDSPALWAEVTNFITSNKRVRITLTKAKVNDIKEKNRWYFKKLPAEIIFESSIYAPSLWLKWGITEPICKQSYDGGVPPIVKYRKKRQTKVLSQVLFDDFVTPVEDTLNVQISVKELDGDLRYKVYESFRDRVYAKIGTVNFSVPLKNGIYPFRARKFSGEVKVEVINYPFPQISLN